MSTGKLTKIFSANLRAIRGDKKPSKMAAELGYSRQHYHKLENPGEDMRTETIEEIATKLGRDPVDLLQPNLEEWRVDEFDRKVIEAMGRQFGMSLQAAFRNAAHLYAVEILKHRGHPPRMEDIDEITKKMDADAKKILSQLMAGLPSPKYEKSH